MEIANFYPHKPLQKKLRGLWTRLFPPNQIDVTKNFREINDYSYLKRNVAFTNIFHFLFQGLKDWNEGQEGDAGWDAEEEDVSNILREHRKMRKYNLSQ